MRLRGAWSRPPRISPANQPRALTAIVTRDPAGIRTPRRGDCQATRPTATPGARTRIVRTRHAACLSRLLATAVRRAVTRGTTHRFRAVGVVVGGVLVAG